jgi:DNA-binding transcriptional MerR regulator
VSVETGLTITDAARASGVSAYTLRYYELVGLIDGVDRADSGRRPKDRHLRGEDQ